MKFPKLNFPESWSHYWSKYPEGFTILESLISWVSQVDKMTEQLNKNEDEIQERVTKKELKENRKLDEQGNFTGSWFGLNKPTLSEEGMRAVVEKLNDETIPIMDNNIDITLKSKTNWLNVVEYGADKTGVVDCTTLVQNLINNNKGCVIYFPKGTYIISQLQLTEGTTIQGDGLFSSVLKSNTPTDMLVLYDELSAYVSIRDIFIDGNYKATRGVRAYKEVYSLQNLDNSFTMENVYVKRCTIANIQLGKEGTASIMECKLTNVKAEQGLGVGFHFTAKCTDSYIEGCYANSNALGGFLIEGYNLKFSNCKACWNGTLENKKSGFIVTKGSFNAFTNCESQDNYGHGLLLDTATNIKIDMITDRNGNGGFNSSGGQIAPETPEHYGIYIKDSYYININTVATNALYTSLGKYTQKGAIGINKSYYVTGNIQGSNQPFYYVVEDELCHNIDIRANGLRWINILPKINITTTTQEGITLNQLNENTFTLNGTATAKTKFDLLGSYGNTNPLMKIPAGSILKVKNSSKDVGVDLIVTVNRTTILANTKRERHLIIDTDTDLSEVALSIDSGKVLDNVLVSPTIEIIIKGI